MTTKSLKLLFLHGFLQNGQVFAEKSSGIRKLLTKANIQCDYIDGPIILEKKDLPFEINGDKWQTIVDANMNRAWFYHSNISEDLDITKGINVVVSHIIENGPYDGIVGFSQGAALSTIIANRINKLIPNHPDFTISLSISGYAFTEPDPKEPGQLQIAEKFRQDYQPCFSNTHLSFIYGESDQAVSCTRTQYLINLCKKAGISESMIKVYSHPGGHMVPNKKSIIRPVVEDIISNLQTS